MPLTVGSRLGHYNVTALIGEGGMGQVYQATDTNLDRRGWPMRRTSPARSRCTFGRSRTSTRGGGKFHKMAAFGLCGRRLAASCFIEDPPTGP